MSDKDDSLELTEFESAVHVNGDRYWSARQVCDVLGYADYRSFRKVIERASAACMRADIPLHENFRHVGSASAGQLDDVKLTRFACYLVAMNADARKEQVARAQAYFAHLGQAIAEYAEAAQQVDRLVVRGDLSDEERSLASTAHAHGVGNFAFFQNAGYRGMYNMDLVKLKRLKGVPGSRSPLDFMYSEELAANLFRITQTNAKIRNEVLRGQHRLEAAAFAVGRTVRETMEELSGTVPERLPAAGDIKAVRAGLRETQRALRKLDAPAPRRRTT